MELQAALADPKSYRNSIENKNQTKPPFCLKQMGIKVFLKQDLVLILLLHIIEKLFIQISIFQKKKRKNN